jgi:hypothetical protein
LFAALVASLALTGCGRQDAPAMGSSAAPTSGTVALQPTRTILPFDEARPILTVFRDDLPAELARRTERALEAQWLAWVARHDAAIRARLDRGDEDTLVNFWLYGSTFTALPRVTGAEASKRGNSGTEDLLIQRLDDLVSAVVWPGANERLQFARSVLQRKGIDPSTPDGQQRARGYLVEARARMIAESDRYRRAAQSANARQDRASSLDVYSTLYRDRGLSTDTSLGVDFNLEQAFRAMKANGALPNVRRVAVIGPGLDFTDKAEGHDFYPQQSIQPFAILDSLVRLDLARLGDLRIVTFDVSPRVNQHLNAARQRAEKKAAYVLQLPIKIDRPGVRADDDFTTFWQRFGDRIGADVAPLAVPPAASDVRVRAVSVRPDVVLSITPYDLDVILERLAPLASSERFDLVVATNVLVYYSRLEQALALANVSAMLRPGGFFLTNYEVHPLAPMDAAPVLSTAVQRTGQEVGDTLFWYRRK